MRSSRKRPLKEHDGVETASPLRPNKYRENDVELLRSGYFADGTIKCQGRTWKVHRALLASRLKFFKAAFIGSFAEAISGEVEFPEATPDSVDIMIRHLYGEELDVEHLNTPLLCVCSWKLADYLQLDNLKSVASSSLQDHLNAMLFLSSSNQDLKKIKPTWLTYFLDAFRGVCAHTVLKPLQAEFVAFLWVARFEMLGLSEIWDTLDKHQDVGTQLRQVLIWHRFVDRPRLIAWSRGVEDEIQCKRKGLLEHTERCSECDMEFEDHELPWFYSPLPMKPDGHPVNLARGWTEIGSSAWCTDCADKINAYRRWGWRTNDMPSIKRLSLQAWSRADGDPPSEPWWARD